MNSKILFEELKPAELAKIIKETGLIYLPLGSLEWHERHLPFGLDAFVSYEICKKACRQTGGCVIPPLFFGTDREHEIKGKIFHGMDAVAEKILPGSIYFIKEPLFYEILITIAQNIVQQGFKKLVIVSAHSGTAQQRVIEKLVKVGIPNLKILAMPGKQFVGSIDHGGKIETSLLMAIKPKLVQKKLLIPPYTAIRGEDPSHATKDLGEKQLEEIINQIVQLVLKM